MPPESQTLILNAERLDALTEWRSSEKNVASLYLPVDSAGAYPSGLSRLIRDATEIDADLRRLSHDLESIERFVRGRFVPGARRGVCVFSCLKYGVFEAFSSPEPFAPSLTAGRQAALGPLTALRRHYPRFLVLLADDRSARFLEVHLGEWEELESLPGDFMSGGLDALAARAEHWRRRRRADRLVLGAAPRLQEALEARLSTELLDQLILEPVLSPDRPNEAVTERVAHNEREARKVRENVLVQRFLDDLSDGGAVAGLEAAAAALQQGCARLLLVRNGFAKMGRCCPSCGRLSVSHRSCPWCFRATEPVIDLVSELTDRAAAAGVEVFRVDDSSRFDAAGRIGVCLAAPSGPKRADVPTGRALRAIFALKDGRNSLLRPRPA